MTEPEAVVPAIDASTSRLLRRARLMVPFGYSGLLSASPGEQVF